MSRGPEGMLPSVWDRIERLPNATRDRVLERAAILHYQVGLDWLEADRRALAEEMDQRTLPGVSR